MNLTEYLQADLGASARVAREVGVSRAFLSQISLGQRAVPPARAAAIERASGFAVRRWDLRPEDWHRIWPELVGTEGAPPVVEEVRDAA